MDFIKPIYKKCTAKFQNHSTTNGSQSILNKIKEGNATIKLLLVECLKIESLAFSSLATTSFTVKQSNVSCILFGFFWYLFNCSGKLYTTAEN